MYRRRMDLWSLCVFRAALLCFRKFGSVDSKLTNGTKQLTNLRSYDRVQLGCNVSHSVNTLSLYFFSFSFSITAFLALWAAFVAAWAAAVLALSAAFVAAWVAASAAALAALAAASAAAF